MSRGLSRTHSSDLIYGKKPLEEILRSGRRRILALYLNQKNPDAALEQKFRSQGITVHFVTQAELDRLAQGAVHQNAVAGVEKYPYVAPEGILEAASGKNLLLALDCIQDPQNFGTLCRSALAFGVRSIILPRDRSVSVTPAVCKASAGAVEHVQICRVTNLVRALNRLKENGYWIYGASLDKKAKSLPEFKPAPKSVLVLGSEGKGLRELVAKTCDELVRIPMVASFDSLNVAQAGTVLMYDLMVKRG